LVKEIEECGESHVDLTREFGKSQVTMSIVLAFIAFILPGGKRLQDVANPAIIRLANLFLKGNVALRTLMHLAGYFNSPQSI
jgi:hypothetical protein